MKKILAALTLSCCSLGAIEIEGDYFCSGYDPYYTQSYTGVVEIIQDDGSVYQVKWSYDQNNSVYESYGTGIRVGNIFSVVFRNLPSEDIPEDGLQVYKVSEGTLEGPYVLLDKNLLGFEKLQKQ